MIAGLSANQIRALWVHAEGLAPYLGARIYNAAVPTMLGQL